MSDPLVFRVRPAAGGWIVERSEWTSAIMAKADALDLARGMAGALRRVGEAAHVVVVGPDGGDVRSEPPPDGR